MAEAAPPVSTSDREALDEQVGQALDFSKHVRYTFNMYLVSATLIVLLSSNTFYQVRDDLNSRPVTY